MIYEAESIISYEASEYEQALFDYYSEDSKSVLNQTFKSVGDKISAVFRDMNIFNPIGTLLSIPPYLITFVIAFVILILGTLKAVLLLGRRRRATAKLTSLRRHRTPESMQLEHTLQQIHGMTREMKHVYRKSKEVQKTAEHFNKVRFYLYRNNKTLTAKVLKEKQPRITGDELMLGAKTGVLPRPYLIERISFGYELNKSLQVIFKDELKFKKVRGKQDSYISLHNHEYQFIIDKLNKVFMEDGIKIKFDRTELN